MFIVVDGIDGSGKGTIVDAMAAALDRAGKRVFDLRAYEKKHGSLPTANDLKKYDVIVSAEPTHAWIGAAIREEMVRSHDYSADSMVDAFALDREVLYRRLLIPLRKMGKFIIQERGLSTTLAYQLVQGATISNILRRPGNALAIKHSPDVLILAILKPEVALRRLASRTGKQDKAIFEKKAFLTKLARRYASPSFRRLFTSRGTRVVSFDTSAPMAVMKKQAVRLLNTLLTSA
ncbi:hypothetical protein A3F28_00655 [Candidatus Uhrbacteria bacterium RIFCSPHIGHO2_12_FULL_57_11]|uniref:Thymidylate kinase n=1 Tax=Candidatus Uhrbacteria bacterium RIFCSPHIGHO2_12_FULL_57_11 TaxID=1802398 RepID=A0A1F7UNH8_9BACT|nr:MAG: hypothetical protein A3F28_00655 [Candidatus Uhrbacteria bacterium RIFCSPHIGHO2_12_FULL_57_11]